MKLHHDETRHRYSFDLPEGEAYVTYVDQGGVRVLNHSYVSPSLRGTGIAAKVVGATFEAVIEEGLPSYPTCSYVHAIASRNPRWSEYFLPREHNRLSPNE